MKVDAQGHFEFKTLPAGRPYSVIASAKGFGSLQSQPQEVDGRRQELPPLVLPTADKQLAGRVVDTDEKPVPGATVQMSGNGQVENLVKADTNGLFFFDGICDGHVNLTANFKRVYGRARAEAGETNVLITLGAQPSVNEVESARHLPLQGKPLPDLAAVDLAAAPTNQALLVCIFDIEQRPSRRFARQVADQFEALKQKGIAVVGIQGTTCNADTFKEWKEGNPVPYPMGSVGAKSPKTKWITDLESLPWLILTDKQGRVRAEGFSLDELEGKLKTLEKE